MKKLTVSTRLGLAFGSLMLLLLVTGSVSYFCIRQLDTEVSLMVDDRYPKTVWANEIIGYIEQTARAMRNMLILDDQGAISKEVAAVNESQALIIDRFAKLQANIHSADGEDALQKAQDLRELYLEGQGHFLRMVDVGVKTQATEYLLSTVAAQQQAYIDAVSELTRFQQEVMRRSGEQSAALASRSARAVAAIALIALLVAFATAVAIIRDLRRQLGGEPACAAAEMRRIAAGDLAAHVQVQPGDTQSLLAALAQMQQSLRRLVGEVRASVDSVSVASTQIASGNLDLSGRTEQQASSLEQTAASMEELTAAVQQSAGSARQASELAVSASATAIKGGESMGEVVATMQEIAQASARINEIIHVIDGIAFQTNILALNAAVEAARAGDQGRGFAVVAGEVRNLAQRSAVAAREIKQMIGDSGAKVSNGSRLVNDAGASMTQIVTQVKGVTELIGQITATANEQSSGIAQVNDAVTLMDQSTQHNAALVEQSAAAAVSLKTQAERLAQAVSAFKLDGAPAAA